MKANSSPQNVLFRDLHSSTDLHPSTTRLSDGRSNAIALLRIAFGLVWAIAASLKWQPAFLSNFSSQVTGAMDGQPELVKNWISFWANIVGSNPQLFGVLLASTETALAVCLIFGLFTNTVCVVGIVLSLGIWSVAEGFGNPYVPGKSTDVGTALPYAILCAVLLFAAAGRRLSIDQWLTPRLKQFGFLASGSLHKKEQTEREQVVGG